MKPFPFLPVDICIIVTVGFFFLTLTLSEALKHNYYTKRDERSLIGPLGFPFGFLETGSYNLTVFDFQLSVPKKRHKHETHSRLLIDNGDSSESDTDSQSPSPMLSEVLDNIKGVGFLLKKFEDEASFNHYIAQVHSDPTLCVFQQYIDLKEADTMDDTIAQFYQDDGGFQYGDDIFQYDDYSGDYGINDDYNGDYDDDYDENFRRRVSKRQQVQRPRPRQLNNRILDEEGELQEQGYGEVIDAVQDGIYLDMLPRSRWRPHSPSVAYNFEAGQAGFYFLIYQVCYKDNSVENQKNENNFLDIHSRFELDFHFSNINMFGRKSYLSVGEMVLPYLFFCFSLLYAICLYLWFSNIRFIKDGKLGYFDVGDASSAGAVTISGNKFIPATPTIYPIHYLMGFLLTLKTLSLFFESIRYHYLGVTGHAMFFSAVYYTFAFLKGITLFTVIVLIGSGWSFVKPFLSEREKKMIFGVLILQVLNNIAIVILTQETEGENSFERWTAVLHLIDILCCCAVLLPIVWQVNQLEKNMEQNQHKEDDNDQRKGLEEDSFLDDNRFDDDEHIPEDEFDEIPMDEKNASNSENSGGDKNAAGGPSDSRMAAKLKLFRSFYILVIAYIYMTRIVVYLFAATLNYKHTWVRIFVVELTTLLFYTTVGYMFRPMNENPYLHLRRRQDSDALIASGEGQAAQVEMRKIDPATKISLD